MMKIEMLMTMMSMMITTAVRRATMAPMMTPSTLMHKVERLFLIEQVKVDPYWNPNSTCSVLGKICPHTISGRETSPTGKWTTGARDDDMT